MAKVAYVVLTHGEPYQTIDFLWSIWRDEDEYFVHIDRKSPQVAFAALAALEAAYPNIHAVPSDICTWGGFTLAEAEYRCLLSALAGDRSWSHAVLVSGTHLPLMRAETLADALQPGFSYLDFHGLVLDPEQVVPPAWWDPRAERLTRVYLEVPGIGLMLGPPRSAPSDATFFLGSQWWVLSREAAEYICASRHSALAEYFRHSCVPDEICFHTLLLNSPLKDKVIAGEIVWQRWLKNRPRALTHNDLAAAFASGKFFARKATESMMRDYSGIIARGVAHVDRRAWVKSVIRSFRDYLPPELVETAIERYHFGCESLRPLPATTSLVTHALMTEIAGILTRCAAEFGLPVHCSWGQDEQHLARLVCRFPHARTKATYLLVVRCCNLESAWIGLYLAAADIEKAREDLQDFPEPQFLDLSFPSAGGLHPHHELLEFELRRGGIIALNRGEATRNLEAVTRTYVGIVNRIPGMADRDPVNPNGPDGPP